MGSQGFKITFHLSWRLAAGSFASDQNAEDSSYQRLGRLNGWHSGIAEGKVRLGSGAPYALFVDLECESAA
jgi:hypothetical protein